MTAGKVFDRMSKGIREAPGKALIGDLAAESGDRTEGAFGELLRFWHKQVMLRPMALVGRKAVATPVISLPFDCQIGAWLVTFEARDESRA